MAAKWSEIREEPVSADEQVTVGPCNYYGFSFRETSGSASATVRVHDSTDNSGGMLDTIQLAPGESAREFYPGGIRAETGLFVDVVSGAVEGSVRVERAGS